MVALGRIQSVEFGACRPGWLQATNVTAMNIRVIVASAAIQGGEPESSIIFQLHDPALDIDAYCTGYGRELTPNGRAVDPGKWYLCFTEDRSLDLVASFQYDSAKSRLTVMETLTCGDDTSGPPYADGVKTDKDAANVW